MGTHGEEFEECEAEDEEEEGCEGCSGKRVLGFEEVQPMNEESRGNAQSFQKCLLFFSVSLNQTFCSGFGSCLL